MVDFINLLSTLNVFFYLPLTLLSFKKSHPAFNYFVSLTRDNQLNENEIKEIGTSEIDNVTENNLINETLKMLLYILDEQKDITIKDIAKKLNKSKTTVKRYLIELKEKGYIERVGSNKYGLWKVVKKSKKTEE